METTIVIRRDGKGTKDHLFPFSIYSQTLSNGAAAAELQNCVVCNIVVFSIAVGREGRGTGHDDLAFAWSRTLSPGVARIRCGEAE